MNINKKKLVILSIGLMGLVFLFLILGLCFEGEAMHKAMFILGLLFSAGSIAILIVSLVLKNHPAPTLTTTPSPTTPGATTNI